MSLTSHIIYLLSFTLINLDPKGISNTQHTTVAQISTSDPKYNPQLIKDGTIEDIISLAKANPLNEKILAAVTQALGSMCNTDELARRAIKAGAGEIVIESIFANSMPKARRFSISFCHGSNGCASKNCCLAQGADINHHYANVTKYIKFQL